MPDKTAMRNSALQGKELSAETTFALKQPAAKSDPKADGFLRSAGSWKGLVDPEALTEVIFKCFASPRPTGPLFPGPAQPPGPPAVKVSTPANLILIGMPGAGKSTIGALVAQRANLGFVDTDALLERREGRTLQQIVDQEGYLGMRMAEERLILSLAGTDQVIATGGSVVYSGAAMRHLQGLGQIIFLHLSLTELLPRLMDLNTRGLVRRPGQSLSDLYIERLPLYRRYADFTVDCGGLDREQAAQRICELLNRG